MSELMAKNEISGKSVICADNGAAGSSSYLILGGCGFIGRHLIQHLIENNLASKIRVVDKILPSLAYLNKEHEACLKNDFVEFVNANLLSKLSPEKVFTPETSFDYVINCAGETRYGLTDPIYYEGVVNLTTTYAKLAAKHNVKRYIEISSGRVASNSKIPHEESDPTNPWTPIANFKLMSEKTLTTIPNLKYTILRPAIVYGPADKTGITPRLIISSIYRHLGETMKILWSRNLMTNTVHVRDLCRAICFVLRREDTCGQIFNVVDNGRTTQGNLNDLISQLFDISTSYVENIISPLYKINFDALIEEINDKHSTPWAELCQKHGVTSTPLSSFLYKEDLQNKHLHLNGTKLAKLGFSYNYPTVTNENIAEIVRCINFLGSTRLSRTKFISTALTVFFINDGSLSSMRVFSTSEIQVTMIYIISADFLKKTYPVVKSS